MSYAFVNPLSYGTPQIVAFGSMPLQISEFGKIPLQFAYFEQYHYNLLFPSKTPLDTYEDGLAQLQMYTNTYISLQPLSPFTDARTPHVTFFLPLNTRQRAAMPSSSTRAHRKSTLPGIGARGLGAPALEARGLEHHAFEELKAG